MDKFLILSAHDYRSPRQANIHFITEELAKRSITRFFSLKYSFISQFKNDWRTSLDNQANKITNHKGVDCYLWKTFIHPFNIRSKKLYAIEAILHYWYARGYNKVLRHWIKDSNIIILESGVAPIFFGLIKELNPNAKILYRASDALDTIDAASYVKNTFNKIAKDLYAITLPSKALADTIPCNHNLAYIPHGIDHELLRSHQPSPYPPGINAVSVGSMLFDTDFFIVASRLFPNINFHIIGSGNPHHSEYGKNVFVYGETPFKDTIKFIKNADFGIAPYCSNELPVYLKDTSMKLIQYDFFGVPAVCPYFVAGDYKTRFGYEIGNEISIGNAISLALASRSLPQVKKEHLSWSDVADRILSPNSFNDTKMTV